MAYNFGTEGSASIGSIDCDIFQWEADYEQDIYDTTVFGDGNWENSQLGIGRVVFSALAYVVAGGDWGIADGDSGNADTSTAGIILSGAADGSDGFSFTGNCNSVRVVRVVNGVQTIALRGKSTGPVTEL